MSWGRRAVRLYRPLPHHEYSCPVTAPCLLLLLFNRISLHFVQHKNPIVKNCISCSRFSCSSPQIIYQSHAEMQYHSTNCAACSKDTYLKYSSNHHDYPAPLYCRNYRRRITAPLTNNIDIDIDSRLSQGRPTLYLFCFISQFKLHPKAEKITCKLSNFILQGKLFKSIRFSVAILAGLFFIFVLIKLIVLN